MGYGLKRLNLLCLVWTALSGLLLGCSTNSIRLSTSPQKAKVLARSVGGEYREIGETPLNLNSSQIADARTLHGPLFLEFRKPGYQSERILVTEISRNDITLHEDLKPLEGLTEPQSVNDAIDQLFLAQRLARQNRYDDALKELNSVEQTSPQLSAIYELRGGIYYLQKKYLQSLDDYTRVTQLNPKNFEAKRMQETLTSLLAGGNQKPNAAAKPATGEKSP